MSLIIPLRPVPNQTLTTTLAEQPVRLEVVQRSTGLFLNIYLNDKLLLGGALCQDRNRIVRDAYFGFVGDFAFYDLSGANDPEYSELGTRYVLAYLEAADLA